LTTSSILAMWAIGLVGRFARYSSRRPSIPPPGWKQVELLCPDRCLFEHVIGPLD
jgi:hypothetical protein